MNWPLDLKSIYDNISRQINDINKTSIRLVSRHHLTRLIEQGQNPYK